MMPTYSYPFRSKLPAVGTTIFTVMSQLATAHGAINLSQGFPDFNCSPELIELVAYYMRRGENQYAPMAGLLRLRQAIAEKTQGLYSAEYDPESEITVTAGATQAIFTAITAVIGAGDEVIIFDPAYDCYAPAVALNGGKAIHIPLTYPDYRINWAEVEQRISARTKMIVINTPNNPTGSILSNEDMRRLEQITQHTQILILSDEVYEHILFDQHNHLSVACYPCLAERSFVISSFGKTYHTTGWKIGYCLAPKALMAEFRKIHQYLVFACNTPIQHALADFLANKEGYLGLGQFYQKKRDYFNRCLSGSRFKALPVAGTYFQLLQYQGITDEQDVEFAVRLTKEHGVAAIPVSVFYQQPTDHRVLRFCFAKAEETLQKAAEVLRSL